MEIEKTNTEGGHEVVPETTETNIVPEPGQTGTVAEGDTSTPTPTEEEFEKIDVTKLKPEEIPHYKHFQSKYTKQRQKDKEAVRQLQEQNAYLQGIAESARANPVSPVAPVTPPAEEEYIDPVVKARLDKQEAEVQMLKAERAKEADERTEEVLISFVKSKGEEGAKQFSKKLPQAIRIVDSMKGSNLSPVEKLEIAYNHLISKDIYEKGRNDALAEFTKKKKIIPPETNSTSTGVVHSKEKMSMEEAFAAAEKIEEMILGG